MRVEFFVRCVPPRATFQQKRVFYNKHIGRVQFVKNKGLAEAEQDFMSLLAGHIPAEPFDTAVRLSVIFVYPFRKGDSRKTRKRQLVPMTVKPDFDNLSKTLCDTMTKLRFWTDDSLVADGRVMKFFGERPGILIRIDAVTDDTAFDGIDGGTLGVLGVSGYGGDLLRMDK